MAVAGLHRSPVVVAAVDGARHRAVRCRAAGSDHLANSGRTRARGGIAPGNRRTHQGGTRERALDYRTRSGVRQRYRQHCLDQGSAYRAVQCAVRANSRLPDGPGGRQACAPRPPERSGGARNGRRGRRGRRGPGRRTILYGGPGTGAARRQSVLGGVPWQGARSEQYREGNRVGARGYFGAQVGGRTAYLPGAA